MAARKVSRDEATKALRTVTPDKAFYFYREIAQPLGRASTSLVEFAETLKDIDPSSIKFHLDRGDFESWFKMLGDKSLASEVASIRRKHFSPGELGARVSSTVRVRISQLQEVAGSR